MTVETTDPRPQLQASLDQTQREVESIQPHQLGLSTPCAEFDVKTLLAHLVAVLRKLAVVGRGGDMTQVADPADDAVADWTAAFRRTRSDFDQVWAVDDKLAEDFRLAWGTMTGSALLDAYAHEFTVHAWDLAQVTGLQRELDPRLAEAALDWYTHNVGEPDRVEGGPFAPAVPVAAEADVYTRLAGYVGRRI